MFMFKARKIKEIRIFDPDLIKSCENALRKSSSDLDFERLIKMNLKNVEMFQ